MYILKVCVSALLWATLFLTCGGRYLAVGRSRGSFSLIDFKSDILPIILIWLVIVCLIMLFSLNYWKETDVKYTFVTEVKLPNTVRNIKNEGYWKAVYVGSFTGKEEIEKLLKYVDDDIGEEFDWEKYSYYITYGCKLERLTYNQIDVWGKFQSPENANYHGKAWLDHACDPNSVFIYRSERIPVMPDAHTQDDSRTIIIRG